MAKKVIKKSPRNIKQMTAIGVMVVVAALLVSAFYVSAKLITMEVPTAPSQSEAKCIGDDCKTKKGGTEIVRKGIPQGVKTDTKTVTTKPSSVPVRAVDSKPSKTSK